MNYLRRPRALMLLSQADSVAWYEALMTRTYNSVLNFGGGLDLWPQRGPIELDGFPVPSEPYGPTPGYDGRI